MAGQALPPREVRQDEPPEIIAPIIGGLQELIFGSPGLFIDRPGFIAGADPDTALGNAVQDLSRYNCRVWAASDKTNYSQRVNQGNADLCGPYLDTLGEKPDPGTVGLPFTGGQCVGVSYTINLTDEQFFSDCSTLVGNSIVGGFIGPIGQVTYSGGSSCPNAPGTTARIMTGAGPVVLSGNGTGVRVTINSVTRDDLGPDNCGNPAPVIEPPRTVTPVTPIPPTININLPGLGPVDVTLTLNPDGEPVVCIPELDVCVTVQPPPDGTGGGGEPPPPVDVPGDPTNGPGDPNAPGAPIEGGPGTPNEDGDFDFGDPPDGRAWVGAFVQIDGGDEVGNVAQSASMQRILPRVVGNAALKHGSVNGTALRLRSEWTGVFRENDNLVVDGIRVAVLPSFSYRVYPVSVEVCPENQCSTEE